MVNNIVHYITMKKTPFFELLSVVKYPILFLIVCWVLFFCDSLFHLELYQLGVSPRTIIGLKGILFSPFIHGDLSHIANNSLPILVLGSLLFYFYKPIAWPVFLWIYFTSGIWLWVGGRNNDVIPHFHFGASTLIYAFSTFLFFSGIFRKHKQLMVVSAMVVFLYGSITWGMFPLDKTMSWEGHLFGALSGVLIAYFYRNEGPQERPVIWPNEDEEVDLEKLYHEQLEQERIEKEQQEYNNQLDNITIQYHYKPTDLKSDDE